MELSDMGEFDGAILLCTKGDEIHVRSTDNISPEQFLEIIMATAQSLSDVLMEADALINRTLQ